MKTDLGRWTLVLAVINLDAYLFLASSDLTCHFGPVTLRTQKFSDCIAPPDSNETKLGSSNKEVFPSAGKNTEVVLVPYCAWKGVPTARCEYSQCSWLTYVKIDEFSKKVTKTNKKNIKQIILNHIHNSLKLNNIQGFCFNFVGRESFLEPTLLISLLYVRYT